MTVKLLGRYDVVREIGKSSYGVVYLANDTRMMRHVVLKKIGPVSMAQSDALLRETRAASTLHHPNIVPMNDLGPSEGSVILVFTHITGETLAQALADGKGFAPVDSIRMAAGILDALSCAHGQGVLHLDIKTSNILLGAAGQPYLLDFGMQQIMLKSQHKQIDSRENPYLPPEMLAGGEGEARSDVYSVGMILYEMLNQQISTGKASRIDSRLESIVLKATENRPQDRFSSAVDMKQALLEYLEEMKSNAGGPAEADVSSTLKFLLRRIKSKSDFPAISGVINQINKTVASDTDDSGKLAQIILQDFSLTNKLLKLVNSSSYSQFGGMITTVSKAVSILGFETVRNIASTLVVVDFLQNKAQSQEMKDAVVSSFFSGIVAVKLVDWKSAQEVEEAMVCSMFFNLGRMLTKFYFFDESEEIAGLSASKGISEDQAALEILGISYNELGLGIAKTWNFPESLIAGMIKISAEMNVTPDDNFSRLNVAVNMANDICAASSLIDPSMREQAMGRIRARYSSVADASDEKVAAVLSGSLQDMSHRSRSLGVDIARSITMENVKKLLVGTVEKIKSDKGESPANIDELMKQTDVLETSDEKVNSEAFLSAGLQDVINTMAGDYKLNDALQMVLETIYRGLRFNHVLIMSRDARKNMMVARFGFGEHIVNILPDFHFSIAHENDVFHLALEKGADIFIEDVGAPNIANKIPQWHGKAVNARCFLILPMVMNNSPIGMIYADMQEAKKLKISQNEMAILRSLRNQAVLAIRQKSQS